jgi:hypothetical protein
MTDGYKMALNFVGIAAVSVMVALILCATQYVPNVALTKAAENASSKEDARNEMYKVLTRCIYEVEPQDIGGRISTIYSMENDEGFLARTTLSCDGEHCVVEARALVTTHARPDHCRPPRRGRAWGWNDYFD